MWLSAVGIGRRVVASSTLRYVLWVRSPVAVCVNRDSVLLANWWRWCGGELEVTCLSLYVVLHQCGK
jgi:hypothetical protein